VSQRLHCRHAFDQKDNVAVIPANAGLRRQDAEANAEGGPKGGSLKRSVIHFD